MHRSTHDKRPMALMISHVMPDAAGHGAQCRAWQLLRLAAQTHEVNLMISGRHAIHLSRWRQVHGLVRRIHLHRDWLGRLPRLDAAPVSGWLDEPVDVALVTEPGLWPVIADLPARQRWCDLHVPRSFMQQRMSLLTSHRRSRRHHARCLEAVTQERALAAACDRVVLAEAGMGEHLPQSRSKTLVIEDEVDFKAIRRAATDRIAPVSRATLLFYADLNLEPCSAALRWFERRVWPTLEHEAPGVALAVMTGWRQHSPLAALRQATAVVCPVVEPALARPLLLQALAVGRPVAAAAEAIAGLGVARGEPLLLPRDAAEWIELSVALSRSAALRQRLERASRQWSAQRGDRLARQRLFETPHDPAPATPEAVTPSINIRLSKPLARAA